MVALRSRLLAFDFDEFAITQVEDALYTGPEYTISHDGKTSRSLPEAILDVPAIRVAHALVVTSSGPADEQLHVESFYFDLIANEPTSDPDFDFADPKLSFALFFENATDCRWLADAEVAEKAACARMTPLQHLDHMKRTGQTLTRQYSRVGLFN